jgi:hypothetical protein
MNKKRILPLLFTIAKIDRPLSESENRALNNIAWCNENNPNLTVTQLEKLVADSPDLGNLLSRYETELTQWSDREIAAAIASPNVIKERLSELSIPPEVVSLIFLPAESGATGGGKTYEIENMVFQILKNNDPQTLARQVVKEGGVSSEQSN